MNIDDYLEREAEIIRLGKELLFGFVMSRDPEIQDFYFQEFTEFAGNLRNSYPATFKQALNIITDHYKVRVSIDDENLYVHADSEIYHRPLFSNHPMQ